MTTTEKLLYQQIHPLKLATDISTSIVATVLLWRHQLVPAMSLGFLPAFVATALVVRFAELDAKKATAFGRYLRENMTGAVTAQRMTGQALAWLAAWHHQAVMMALGFTVIVLAWLSGLRRPVERAP